MGLLQFAFPHGIQNGAEVTLNAVDTGEGIEYPLAAGALGRLTGTTTYYAISGTANSLEDDQLKLAITASNAELGDAIGFVNSGTGRQQVLTESFGAAATANVITSTFLEGELVLFLLTVVGKLVLELLRSLIMMANSFKVSLLLVLFLNLLVLSVI